MSINSEINLREETMKEKGGFKKFFFFFSSFIIDCSYSFHRDACPKEVTCVVYRKTQLLWHVITGENFLLNKNKILKTIFLLTSF